MLSSLVGRIASRLTEDVCLFPVDMIESLGIDGMFFLVDMLASLGTDLATAQLMKQKHNSAGVSRGPKK